ncbi:MAG: hypothetical protein R6U98_29085 [Pirellulaceae bacterium]
MASEAKRRRFFEGRARVFLGDGLPWNWTIWRERFRDFTPVLDFIHPLSHLFLVANVVHPTSPDNAWSQYGAWMRGGWRGEVGQVIDGLASWQIQLRKIQAGGDVQQRYRFKLAFIRQLYSRGYARDDIIKLFRFMDYILVLAI